MYASFALFGLLAPIMAAVIGEKPIEFRCGSENPPAEIVAQAQAMAIRPQPMAAQTINVNTYFHVVTTQAKVGIVTQTQLNNQVSTSLLLNADSLSCSLRVAFFGSNTQPINYLTHYLRYLLTLIIAQRP